MFESSSSTLCSSLVSACSLASSSAFAFASASACSFASSSAFAFASASACNLASSSAFAFASASACSLASSSAFAFVSASACNLASSSAFAFASASACSLASSSAFSSLKFTSSISILISLNNSGEGIFEIAILAGKTGCSSLHKICRCVCTSCIICMALELGRFCFVSCVFCASRFFFLSNNPIEIPLCYYFFIILA